MPFTNLQKLGKPLKIKDEGITLVNNASSIDFTGSGVAGSALGDDVTEAISGGGGSGFTKLPATGSVDGSNVAFTFTQKPEYIVSDGAWYVENKGWTWSGLTATMTIPPNDTIFGFV